MMDLHALTTVRNAELLREDVRTGVAVLLACGVTPTPNRIVFVQSRVPQHAELAWILSCVSPLNMLEDSIHFKDKIAVTKSATLGLLSYPVLMAADILLYKATHVPVGHDQVQHLELARHISKLFTNAWGLPLSLPQAVVEEDTARIMSLSSSDKKMSKSDPNPNSRILVSDSPDVITSKIRRAVTDSLGPVTVNSISSRPGVANLISILTACKPGGFNPAEAEGWTAAQLKSATTDAVIAKISPIASEMARLRSDPEFIDSVIAQGAERARALAEVNMREIRKAVGLV